MRRIACAVIALMAWRAEANGSETRSSTVAAPSPGDVGNAARAPMPQGGVPTIIDGTPLERRTPQGGVEDGLRRPAMPPADFQGPVPATRGSASPPGTGASMSPDGPDASPDILNRRFGDFADGPAQDSSVQVDVNGYLRLILEAIENDDDAPEVGRSDGFKLANARVGLRLSTRDLVAYISADASVGEREVFDDPRDTLTFVPRDLLLRYGLAEFASITIGRFKTPYDLGQLETTPHRVFIDRPVESRGVLRPQGIETDGMSQGRQLGAMLHKERLGLNRAGFDFGYALSISNGRVAGLALNDNDRVAAFARASVYWSDVIQLNVAGFIDNRTITVDDGTVDEDVRGLELSLLVKGGGFSAEGQLLLHQVDVATGEGTDADPRGVHGQLAYTYGGFRAAYRFAYFDPDASNAVTEHTLGIDFASGSLPLRFTLNGTLAFERQAVRTDNHRLAFLTQFTF